MSRNYQRNRDRDHGRRQNFGGGGKGVGGARGYNQNMMYQGDMSRQMMNPWQSGMMPRDGGGMQGSRPNEAALAFNILNQVLATDSGPVMNMGQHQRGGFQDGRSRDIGVKSRLDDRRRGRSPDFSNRNRNRKGKQGGGGSRSPSRRDDRDNRSASRHGNLEQEKRPVRERLGKPQAGKKSSGTKRTQNQDQAFDKKRKTDKDKGGSESSEKSRRDSKSGEGDNRGAKESEFKENEYEENDENLVKHLKCHVCEVYSFESVESFLAHRESEDHKVLFDIFNQRNEAVLRLLRADSRLSTCRDREQMGYCNRNTYGTKCVKCDCLIPVGFKHHKKTIEHELVDNQILRQCCDKTFVTRKDFEEHILSLPHFRRLDNRDDTYPEGKVVIAHTDEEEAAFKHMKECKEAIRLDSDSAAEFPEYDPEKPIGMEYVHQKRRYSCTICKKSFPSFNDLALSHCRSFGHYLKVLAYLQPQVKEWVDIEPTLLKKMEEEKIKKIEEEKNKKIEEEKKKKMEEEKKKKLEEEKKKIKEEDVDNEENGQESQTAEGEVVKEEAMPMEEGPEDVLPDDYKDAEVKEEEGESKSGSPVKVSEDNEGQVQAIEEQHEEECFDEEMPEAEDQEEEQMEPEETEITGGAQPEDEEMPEEEEEMPEEEEEEVSETKEEEEEEAQEITEEEEEEEAQEITEEDNKDESEAKVEEDQEEEVEEEEPPKPKTRARRGRRVTRF